MFDLQVIASFFFFSIHHFYPYSHLAVFFISLYVRVHNRDVDRVGTRGGQVGHGTQKTSHVFVLATHLSIPASPSELVRVAGFHDIISVNLGATPLSTVTVLID